MPVQAFCISATLFGLYCSMICFARFSPGVLSFFFAISFIPLFPFFHCSTISAKSKKCASFFLTYTLYFTILRRSKFIPIVPLFFHTTQCFPKLHCYPKPLKFTSFQSKPFSRLICSRFVNATVIENCFLTSYIAINTGYEYFIKPDFFAIWKNGTEH